MNDVTTCPWCNQKFLTTVNGGSVKCATCSKWHYIVTKPDPETLPKCEKCGRRYVGGICTCNLPKL